MTFIPHARSASEEWGYTGIVMLLCLRVIQGLSTGGEIAGVSVYLAEYKEQEVWWLVIVGHLNA